MAEESSRDDLRKEKRKGEEFREAGSTSHNVVEDVPMKAIRSEERKALNEFKHLKETLSEEIATLQEKKRELQKTVVPPSHAHLSPITSAGHTHHTNHTLLINKAVRDNLLFSNPAAANSAASFSEDTESLSSSTSSETTDNEEEEETSLNATDQKEEGSGGGVSDGRKRESIDDERVPTLLRLSELELSSTDRLDETRHSCRLKNHRNHSNHYYHQSVNSKGRCHQHSSACDSQNHNAVCTTADTSPHQKLWTEVRSQIEKVNEVSF